VKALLPGLKLLYEPSWEAQPYQITTGTFFISILLLKILIMLRWAVIFIVIAIIAAIFGFTGIAAGAASIAKVLFFIFIVLFLLTLIFGAKLFGK